MKTLKQVAVASALFALLPFATLANGDNDDRVLNSRLNSHSVIGAAVKAEVKAELKNKDNKKEGRDEHEFKLNSDSKADFDSHRSVVGSVTAVSSTGFELKSKDGANFTVNASAATIVQAFGQTIALANIKVNDNVVVKGTLNGNVITAVRIVVTPQNTHRAAAFGTVTAVNGNTITLQSTHRGVAFPVTVNTTASTTVVAHDGKATTTAAVTVGAKVWVKGLWDELLNVLRAFKIRIK